jgi:hypothetical protein
MLYIHQRVIWPILFSFLLEEIYIWGSPMRSGGQPDVGQDEISSSSWPHDPAQYLELYSIDSNVGSLRRDVIEELPARSSFLAFYLNATWICRSLRSPTLKTIYGRQGSFLLCVIAKCPFFAPLDTGRIKVAYEEHQQQNRANNTNFRIGRNFVILFSNWIL